MNEHRDVVSVLSFEKKLVPSDGIFYGTSQQRADSVTPLKLQEKSVRGTLSFRQKKKSESQLPEADKYMGRPNLQTVDTCALGPEQDTLLFRFTLKVIGGLQYPSACNNAVFRQRYEKVAAGYLAREKCREQGRRYALNIANARFLWRNRVGAEHIEVTVSVLNKGREQQWLFDAYAYSIRDFNQRDADISTLGEKIAQALSGDKGALLLEISARVQSGKGQTVYPSGELILNKGKGTKSKVLYHIDGTAAMHSQKIGNALRSVDTWYPAYSDPLNSAGAIAVEPFGAVTHLGMVFRPPGSGQDFYTLFYKWVYGELLQENEEHYVVAVLIRGGVFGEGDK